jgi:uncharacterized membrane protein
MVLGFEVDQLVATAIRALSPAVNDTFTAVTCIDWLSDGLCRIADDWRPHRVHRDHAGKVRLIGAPIGYDRLVERVFDKIRQAGMARTRTADQRHVLLRQAELVERANRESVPEEADRADVHRRYDVLLATHAALAGGEAPRRSPRRR